MARLHHRSIGNAAFPEEPIQILGLITDFLEGCKRPAVLEAGADLAKLVPGQYTIEVRAGRVWIECWSVEPSLSRRILAIESRKAGALTCSIHRFGGKPGSLTFLDLDRAQTSHRVTAGFRQSFSEQFRQMLFRQFPGWEIPHLSTSPDLRRSFSPRFPRARLVRGNRIAAAMACPSPELETEFLSFALLWFDHIRAGAKQAARTTLSLFLPDGAGNLTAHRLRWLREDVLQPRLFLFNEHGSAGEVDPQDLGNLETRVASGSVAASGEPSFSHVVRALIARSEVTKQQQLNGAISLRFRGLEFARIDGGRFLLGIEDPHEIGDRVLERAEEFLSYLRNVTNQPGRHAQTAGFLPGAPERWLESCVRGNLACIDPDLLPEPVHGQVLTFAAGDRTLIDLLAVSKSGRLSVLELKATEDLQLPLQALDYWMRIRWHAERSELAGLFPGVSLARQPPQLLLVAPALNFHSSTAIVLRYFSPEIEVERIGVNSNWRDSFKVVLRLKGADAPISHGRFNVGPDSIEYQESPQHTEPETGPGME